MQHRHRRLGSLAAIGLALLALAPYSGSAGSAVGRLAVTSSTQGAASVVRDEATLGRPKPDPADEAALGLPMPDSALAALIAEVLGDASDQYGVVVKELAGGTGAAVNPDKLFYAASLYKLPILYEAYRQRESEALSFLEELSLTEEYAAYDLGTLDLLGFSTGNAVPIGRLLEAMITVSDNTSAVMLTDRLGADAIDRGLAHLGLSQTSVNTQDLPTSAADMALLLEAIARGQAVSPAASAEMAALLLQQQVRDRIPAGLPEGVAVANKTGNWTEATHDVGIVYGPSTSYVLAVLSEKADDGALIAELSRRVYQYYHDPEGPGISWGE